jgi:ATP-dependent RNA helicase DeaD
MAARAWSSSCANCAGAHVIVGTPGRVMDHIERKSLNLDSLSTLVLDEADEMLRMGFIDDVEWILQRIPAERQTALFSATMPDAIRRVAHRYLRDPKEVKIKAATSTVSTIRQRFLQIAGAHKLDALTRILEVEDELRRRHRLRAHQDRHRRTRRKA